MSSSIKVGILALQGAVAQHEEKLNALGAASIQVRTKAELKDIAGLIMPGGESTAMIHLLKNQDMWDDLKEFSHKRPVWGICAGSILLAKSIAQSPQDSLGAIDIEVARNAYGRQIDSFIDELTSTPDWNEAPERTEGVFIRAPKIEKIGPNCRVLWCHDDKPVMIREKNVLVSTFHPELSPSLGFHRYFLQSLF